VTDADNWLGLTAQISSADGGGRRPARSGGPAADQPPLPGGRPLRVRRRRAAEWRHHRAAPAAGL